MKQSLTSLWRREKHARKYASPIQSYFPVIERAAKKPRVESTVPPDPLVIEPVVGGESESGCEPEIHLARGKEPSNVELEACEDVAASTSKTNSVSKDKEQMTLETYQSALRLLELSMDRLKLNIQSPIEPQSNDVSAPQVRNTHEEADLLALMEPSSPPCPQIGVNAVPNEEEGPTIQDAEEAVLIEPVDVDLLEGVDEDERDEPFDIALSRHLKRLLNVEKKSKTPNSKRLIELTMLSDYNNLRKTYINAGFKSPSMLASNRIAEAKFVPSAAKPVYQHESWFARRLRVKAYHLVRFGLLPESKQGKGASHYSILCEEDVRRSILTYLRTLKTGTVRSINYTCNITYQLCTLD
jgi:hypothetical protein